ncbi:hypothetical protein KIL84_013501 [Mauremys mutica]|uniref:Uncharacterized protein n=1 Tax=Mauremys mutica TaxID=74926 RepID=A0A9D3WXD1_9SAUR|nr:hypothetical protein KIL84_013501 [Mauremys mutica]
MRFIKLQRYLFQQSLAEMEKNCSTIGQKEKIMKLKFLYLIFTDTFSLTFPLKSLMMKPLLSIKSLSTLAFFLKISHHYTATSRSNNENVNVGRAPAAARV